MMESFPRAEMTARVMYINRRKGIRLVMLDEVGEPVDVDQLWGSRNRQQRYETMAEGG